MRAGGEGGVCVCVCVGASPAGSVKARGAHRFLCSSLLCHSPHAQTLLGKALGTAATPTCQTVA